MIRDIKFRVWVKGQKEMVEVIELNFHQATIASIYDDYASGEQEWDLEDFENVELMQSTGSKDKNGTEIYEGDILNHFNKVYGVIRLSTGTYLGRTSTIGEQDIVLSWTSSDGELIGNIYENPELLQEGK